MKKEEAELVNRIGVRLRELFKKENLYRNGYFIYRMNSQLEFPLDLLTEELRPLTSRGDLIRKAMDYTDFMEYQPDTKRVKLIYRGSSRIVVVTGIKQSFIQEMLSNFKAMRPRSNFKVVTRKDKIEIETESQCTASDLKSCFRQRKRSFDLREDFRYKTEATHKIRIVVESQDLYTLLLDSIFEEERATFNSRFNQRPGPYEPILVNGFYGPQPREEEDEFYSEDKTSNLSQSQTQESRFYKDLIETHEVSTQLTQNDGLGTDLLGAPNSNQILYNEAVVFLPPKPDAPSPVLSRVILLQNSTSRQAPQADSPFRQKQQSPLEQQPNPASKLSQTDLQKQQEGKEDQRQASSEDQQGSQLTDNDQIKQISEEEVPAQSAHTADEQQNGLYSFQFIEDLYLKLLKDKKLERPDGLNPKTVDVAAEDLSRKLFFDKLYEKNSRRKRKSRNSDEEP